MPRRDHRPLLLRHGVEPPYVDITVKRWEEFTGQEARREDGK